MENHFLTKKIIRTGKALAALVTAAVMFCCIICAQETCGVFADEKKDDEVSFTVYYQDTNGKELASPQIFYGKPGDKPLISGVHIEGYVPQVKQITKTISEDSEENVFTFVYDASGTSAESSSGTEILDIDETRTPLAYPGKPQAGMRESGNGLTLILAVTCLAVLGVFGMWRSKKKREEM